MLLLYDHLTIVTDDVNHVQFIVAVEMRPERYRSPSEFLYARVILSIQCTVLYLQQHPSLDQNLTTKLEADRGFQGARNPLFLAA